MRRRSGDLAVTDPPGGDGGGYAGLADGARLALGTLTVFPVRPPLRVDRYVGAWAMTLAPAVGGLLAAVAGVLLWLLGRPPRPGLPVPGDLLGVAGPVAPPLVAATLVIGLLAALTRGMHLDGLADTSDGLGSGRPPAAALEVMRRGDVGPFGVVALVFALLLQVSALAALVEGGHGFVAVGLTLVVSRLALPVLCSRGVPAARPDGLGQVVAGTVGRGRLSLSGLLAASVLMVLVAAGYGADPPSMRLVAGAVAAAFLGLAAAGVLARRAVRRLGGVTGDVLGAGVEVAFTTTMVVLALVA